MSVFTPLQHEELEAFLAPYGLGRLQEFEGIAAGSENSNFFVSVEQGQYVLTLVERGPTQDLPFFIELLEVLHRAGLPVPYALQTADGEALRNLAGKPALLQPRLPGRHVAAPNAHHCSEVAGCWRACIWRRASRSLSDVATAAWTGCRKKAPASPWACRRTSYRYCVKA